MDVRDQSIKIDKARDQYREAQENLRSSYDKNVKDMKETFDSRVDKKSKNFAEQKTKLEEANQVNNQLYTEKTKDAINRSQEDFKERLRGKTSQFEQERTKSKTELNDKLTSIRDSYKKSSDENNRYQDQVKKSMTDRYTNANKSYQSDFNKKINDMDQRSKETALENREYDHKERLDIVEKNSEELDSLRSNASEEKFKEIGRLRNDTENLRTTLERENQLLKDRQEERVSDLVKLKGKETEAGMKNFEVLQQGIRQKNLDEQSRLSASHNRESKNLEKKFNDDIRNIQSIANQKIKGGTSVDTLSDELKQTKESYEKRLGAAREDIVKNNEYNTEKEENTDFMYREKLKEMKSLNVDKLAKKDLESNNTLNKVMHGNRDKNNVLVERFNEDNGALKKASEDRLSQTMKEGSNKIKDQRVEFGRVVNTLNDKNMDTINALKEDFSKDKSMSIERSKKEFNQEKVTMKQDFNRQGALKETLYEQKLAEMEKQTNKVIENYENRISQLARKAENEVEAIKSKSEARAMKENMANALEVDTMRKQNNNDTTQMREKYEGVIAKTQAMSEYKINGLVQKYEDQISRERSEGQKELSLRMTEAQVQFERLYKSSELEKETMRNQYEQRMENMRLAALAQENSKKA